MRQFDIIGAGMGTRETLTGEAAQALASAEMVFATERLAEICENAQICLFSELAERAIACGADRAALLVSGDVGFFSAAGKLREKLLAHGEVRLFCGLSSMQYLCAKIGISYENACIRSLHGRKGDLLGAVSYHEKTFALTGGDNNVQFVCRSLADAGLGGVQVYIGENLGSPRERVLKGTASELAENPCADLAVMLVLNPNSVNPFEPVRDEMLTRAKVPMTKEEIRHVSICKLHLKSDSVLYDVGSGTGSIAVEAASLSDDMEVYAIEQKENAVQLITQNKEKHGLENIHVIKAKAPDGMDTLPVPTHAFIGGSSGNLKEIIEALKVKNPHIRIVINAISMETICEIKEILSAYDVKNEDIVQLQVSRSKQIGHYHLMQAENPVWICSFEF